MTFYQHLKILYRRSIQLYNSKNIYAGFEQSNIPIVQSKAKGKGNGSVFIIIIASFNSRKFSTVEPKVF